MKYNDAECEAQLKARLDFIEKYKNNVGKLGFSCALCYSDKIPDNIWTWHYSGIVFHKRCLEEIK